MNFKEINNQRNVTEYFITSYTLRENALRSTHLS